MTHLDLFSGIGGFALAAQANRVETKVFCEQNEHCINFLTAQWGLPIIRDVRQFDGTKWRGAWLLTAGVPCQPASRAGKQGGETDDRWLWPETIRVIEESKPTWALLENPPGILDVGLDGILSELGRIGYESQPLSIPACAVNSPQDRERIWIIAHLNVAHSGHDAICAKFGESLQERDSGIGKSNQGAVGDSKSGNGRLLLQPRRSHETVFEFERSVESSVADRTSNRHQTKPPERQPRTEHPGGVAAAVLADGQGITEWPGLCPTEQAEIGRRRLGDISRSWADSQWIACEKGKVRRFPNQLHVLDHGLPNRILEALGNAICWPVAAQIIKAMIQSDCEEIAARKDFK